MITGRHFFPPFLLLILLFPCAQAAPAAPPSWTGGAASIAITPEHPLILEGYIPPKIASEKITDVYAKALALQDPKGNRVVVVTSDLQGYDYGFTAEVAKEVERRYKLPREALLFNAAHNHSAPAIFPAEWQLLYGCSREEVDKVTAYIEWTKNRFITVIGEALSAMQPLTVSFSTAAPAPFAMSRRYPTEKGISYRSGPGTQYSGGPRDDISPVLKVTGTDGKLKAVLFGYACHPITLNGEKFCGDYPGFAQQYLQEMYPGVVALFMQGCGGQLVPNARYQVEYAMGHGRTLADAVRTALEGPQTPLTGPIRCAYAETTLEFEPPPDRTTLEAQSKSSDDSIRRKASFLLDKLNRGEKIQTSIPCPLQAVRFGKELLLIGLSGETVADYAVTLKSENLTQFTWVAGYCNYVYAYLPTWQILKEGGYEGGEAIRYSPFSGPFKEDVESRVLTGAREVVKKASGR